MKKPLFLLIIFFTISIQSQNIIEKISFSTEGYASAPDFDLIIYSNKTIIFNARSDNYKIPPNSQTVGYGTDNKNINIRNSEIKGIYVAKLKTRSYKEIVNLIFSLEKEFEKKCFNSNTLHNSIGKLKVTYKSGKIESIYDNGMKGTETLSKLYDYMKDLRFDQEWK